MPSDDSTVATQADFVPMAVGNTDRVRSVVSVSAHDGFSHHLRSGMQQGRLSVLALDEHLTIIYIHMRHVHISGLLRSTMSCRLVWRAWGALGSRTAT